MNRCFTHFTGVTISTLVEILRWRATQQPNKSAYTFLLDGETQEAHLTYAQLDRQARAIGAQLQSLGVTGERALLLYPPGLEYIAGFFGCLYAGGAAVPAYPPDPTRLNRTLPRLRAIVKDAQPLVALTTAPILTMVQSLFAQDPDFGALHWLATDGVADDLAQGWREPALGGDALAFLQYTSGSTAAPKGVMLTHDNLLHNSALIYQCFGHTPGSQGVIWLPPYHDMGLIGGIIQPLYGGFPVTLMSPLDFLKRPLRWLQAVSRYQATTSGGPNFAYDLCVRKITPEQRADLDLSSWDLAFNGAEPVRHETMERFARAFAPCGFRQQAFYPCYGLAEATLIVSGGAKTDVPVVQHVNGVALGQDQVETVPPTHPNAQALVGCGRALADQHISIVHPHAFHPCLPGQVGEIWLSGPSMAQGYWGQPEETAQTFQAHLADGAEGPFLRTGDLGFLQDGELFVTGRLKDLLIIRGQNHYPQDIELTVEQSHPALRPGCSAAFSITVAGEERLVVAQEVRAGVAGLDAILHDIRQAVAEAHELQVYGVLLLKARSIPKTSSGKIQRHACRAGFLSGELDVVAESILEVAPVEPTLANSVEPTSASSVEPAARQPDESFIRKALDAVHDPAARHSLLTIYLQEQAARVLRLSTSQISLQQSLSGLGLDSLMAVELAHEVETSLDTTLPVVTFLQGPTLSQLASAVLAQLDAPAETSDDDALVAASEPLGEHPLSFGQQALWFLYQLAPESAAYNVPSAVRVRSPLNVPALQRALEKLVARHSILRTTFTVSAQGPVQCVHARTELDFEAVDTSEWSEAALDERLAQEANRPFDLERGPLLRARVFTRAQQDHVILLVMHHIVTDFWSLALLVEDLSLLYPAECRDAPVTLPALELQYADYARWQTQTLDGPRGERLRDYWTAQLAGELPVLNLPADHPRPPVQTYNGDVHTVRLSAELTTRLKALAQAHDATLYVTLLAAFQTLLYRYTGQEDLLIGSLSAGRTRAELTGVMGYFVNPIVLRARPSPAQTFADLLAQTRQTALEALEHQDYPFNVLVDQLGVVRDYSRSPLFQVMFAFQKAFKLDELGLTPFALDIAGAEMELAGLRLESKSPAHRASQFDLTLTMGAADDELVASFEYNTDLFEAETIAQMALHFQILLEGVVTDPQQRLAVLPLLPESERRQLLVDWNGAQVDRTPDTTVRALFEAQAARTPNAPAVIFGGGQLSYAELDRRANQLATYLQGLGVGPEQVVGICVERSPELIVGLLGVLKTGGAYLPLDPEYPPERLAFMLADAGAGMLLTQAHLRDCLPQNSPLICLDADWPALVASAPVTLARRGLAENLACVIYTSGSTGQPKGVLLENGSLVNLIQSFLDSYQPTADDRILPLTSVASASFVGEVLPLLCVGGALVLSSKTEFLDFDELFDLIGKQGVSIVSTVPAVIAGLNDGRADGSTELARALSQLRLLLSGGEALAAGDVDQLLRSVAVVNSYGVTETAVCSTFYKLDGPAARPGAGVPIGRPIVNTAVYVLDANLNPLPIGCPGELYVAGIGLARGYLGNSGLTAERFVPRPFSPPSSPPGGGKEGGDARMYRTGDLARWLRCGILEYLGRVDHQVKIRGFRVELGEVEAVLKGHPSVRDGVVVARGATSEEKRLVAYVVPAQADLAAQDLYEWLLEQVPPYMVPTAFEMLEALPLTANGKVDLRALPAPDRGRAALGAQYVAPQSEIERAVAAIWQTVLKLDQVGIHDSFFELGGNSLLIAQVHRRLREELKLDLSLADMFKYPTISALAASQKQPPKLSQANLKDEAQKRKAAQRQRQRIMQQSLRSLEKK